MAQGVQIRTGQGLAFLERRQRGFLVVQGGFGVVRAFDIGPEETRKINVPARGSELGIFRFDGDGLERQPGFRHLRGDGALPDEFIQFELLAAEAQFFRGQHFVAGGADGFVGFLGVLGFARVLAGRWAEVFLAIAGQHARRGRRRGIPARGLRCRSACK